MFGVSQKKEKILLDDMEKFDIREEDIEENFIRPSSKGGQKSDKSSNCVHITHVPTGIIIKCQKTRSRALNRYYARQWLVEKIEDIKKGIESRKRQKIEKIRRQKRKRSKRAKEKILRNKKNLAAKKKLRKPVDLDRLDT